MALPNKRTVATWFEDDHIRLIEQDVPDLRPGSIAVDVGASSVSPGSELSANRDGREVLADGAAWRSRGGPRTRAVNRVPMVATRTPAS